MGWVIPCGGQGLKKQREPPANPPRHPWEVANQPLLAHLLRRGARYPYHLRTALSEWRLIPYTGPSPSPCISHPQVSARAAENLLFEGSSTHRTFYLKTVVISLLQLFLQSAKYSCFYTYYRPRTSQAFNASVSKKVMLSIMSPRIRVRKSRPDSGRL